MRGHDSGWCNNTDRSGTKHGERRLRLRRQVIKVGTRSNSVLTLQKNNNNFCWCKHQKAKKEKCVFRLISRSRLDRLLVKQSRYCVLTRPLWSSSSELSQGHKNDGQRPAYLHGQFMYTSCNCRADSVPFSSMDIFTIPKWIDLLLGIVRLNRPFW